MNLLDYIFYLFVTYLIYIIFFGLIAIFGYILLFFLRNRNTRDLNLSKLEFIFISFAIGIALYLILAYSLLTLEIFNFFTGYLSIILLYIVFVLYYLRKKKIRIDSRKFKNFLVLKKKQIIFSILIISSITFIQFLEFWPILVDNSSLLARDTYKWTAKVWYILDNGNINNQFFNLPLYPEGSPIIWAGSLMISPTKTISYFFMKFGCMPILSTYILVMYTVSKRFFKKKFLLIFFCLILILISRYFMYRTILFLPSSLANLLIFVSTIIVLTKLPNYLLGFIIPAIYLIHLLSALFLILCLGIFYIIKFFKSFSEIKPFFKEILTIFFLIIVSLIPFFVYIYITFEISIVAYIDYYLESIIPQISSNVYQININELGYSIQTQWIDDMINIINIERMRDLFDKYTIGPFLLLSFFGIIIMNKKRKREGKEFVLILKIGLLLTVIIYYFGFLIGETSQSTLYDYAIYRPLETFTPHIILLSALTLETLLKKSEKLWKLLRKRYSYLIFSYKIRLILKNITFKSFLITVVIASSLFYSNTRQKIQPNYYYLTLPEVILYINDNIPYGTRLSVPSPWIEGSEFSDNVYAFLVNYNLIYYRGTSDLTYSRFLNFCEDNIIKYIILKKSSLNYSNFLRDFENSTFFTKIFQVVDSDLHYGIYLFNK